MNSQYKELSQNKKTQMVLKQSNKVNAMLVESFPKTCKNFSSDTWDKEMKNYVKFVLNADVLTPSWKKKNAKSTDMHDESWKDHNSSVLKLDLRP